MPRVFSHLTVCAMMLRSLFKAGVFASTEAAMAPPSPIPVTTACNAWAAVATGVSNYQTARGVHVYADLRFVSQVGYIICAMLFKYWNVSADQICIGVEEVFEVQFW